MSKSDKILCTIASIMLVFITVGAIWFVFEVKEMMNDYRCNQLPLNEFFQDKKCEKYWRYK